MNLKIFTFTFNRPDILELQYKTFKKYCKNNFDFIVIHDSRNNEYVNEISNICKRNNLEFYHHSSLPGKEPSEYHSDVVTWTYENIITKKYNDDIIFLLDHDIFMLEDFDIIQYMDDCDMLTLFQRRPHRDELMPSYSYQIDENDKSLYYSWTGLSIFKNNKLKNKDFDFKCKTPNQLQDLPKNERQNLDTGGGTYKLFKDKSLIIKDIGYEHLDYYNGFQIRQNPINKGHDYILMCQRKFLHYKNASNWHLNYHINDNDKTNMLLDIFKELI